MIKWSYLLILIATIGCTSKDKTPEIARLDSPTSSLLQAISMVDDQIIWASGHNASFIRTTDGGQHWDLFQHPTGDSLQFRDIHAFSPDQVILMSAGPGSLSRIFTFSQDSIWKENFVMLDSLGFLDCLDFWDEKRGIAYGDSFDGYPYILLSNDGGATWTRTKEGLPTAGKGEGGFAASGTCVTTAEGGKAWIATGAGGNCRVLLTENYGKTWTAIESPIVKGAAAGNTSVSFVGDYGFLTGGDLAKGEEYTDNCAFSTDGGQTWALANQPQTLGAFYCGSIAKVSDAYFSFACGPNGIDYSRDLGQTWNTLDTLNYWAISFKNETGFAVGRDGKILKISL